MLKLVGEVRWVIAVTAKSNERKKTEYLEMVEVSYVAGNPLLHIYTVT